MKNDDTQPNRPNSLSPFNEPISADLPRRQLDRKILESYDATQERIRNISSRVTRMEALFESVHADLRRLEESQKEMAAHLETTAASMAAISHKLAVHTEMEEFQWITVNKANDTLAQVGTALNQHLIHAEQMATRISGIERLIWAMWGIFGACALALIPLVLKGLEVKG